MYKFLHLMLSQFKYKINIICNYIDFFSVGARNKKNLLIKIYSNDMNIKRFKLYRI